MGIGRFVEGAPQRDPEFILPPDPEEILDVEQVVRNERNVRISMRVAFGGAALVLAGSAALIAFEVPGSNDRETSAASSESPSTLRTSSSPSASASPSPTESSASPSPSPSTETPSPSFSPSHIPSPSATASRVVTVPTPTKTSAAPSPSPTPSESQAPSAACEPNPNAPGEVVCSRPVWAYTTPTGSEQAFQIIGGAAPDCSRIEAGRVVTAIGNDEGWASLSELGNPC